MSDTPRHKGKLIALAAAAALVALLVAVGLDYRAIVSRIVTARAWEDAARHAGEVLSLQSGDPEAIEEAAEERARRLAEAYGDRYRRGFFDPGYVIRRVPPTGLTPDCLPAWILVGSYLETLEKEDLTSDWGPAELCAEVARWIRPIALEPPAKEALVHILTSDHDVPGTQSDRDAGLIKLAFTYWLYHEEFEAVRRECLGALEAEHWKAVVRDSRHAREKARAGALLLLYHHPSRTVFHTAARDALNDPSEWPRLAAASVLGIDGDPAGREILLGGLDHARWEIRFWCAVALMRCAGEDGTYADLLEKRAAGEPDNWVRKRYRELCREWRKDRLTDDEWAFGRVGDGPSS